MAIDATKLRDVPYNGYTLRPAPWGRCWGITGQYVLTVLDHNGETVALESDTHDAASQHYYEATGVDLRPAIGAKYA